MHHVRTRGHKRIEPISGSEPRREVDALAAREADESAIAKAKFEKAVESADISKVEIRPKERVASDVSITSQKGKGSLVDLAKKTAETPKVPPTIEELDATATRIRKNSEYPRARLLAVDAVSPDAATMAKVADHVTAMSGHIEHMDRTLRDISKAATGVEAGTLVDQEKPPLVRFLKYLTESDKRLATTVQEISALNATPQKLTPQQLLSVQVKMNFIQQELEFFTNALSKGIESIKTIMNVQI